MKRFTLMMMVMCFLMSIPLKMMAEIVTIHFVDEDGWGDYAAYVYDRTITGEGSQPWVTAGWPGQKVASNEDIKTLANGKKVVTWKIDLKSCSLSNALVIFNNNSNNDVDKKQYPSGSGWAVQNGLYYYKNGTTSTTPPSEGSGSGTGGGGGTTGEWNTVTNNRLTAKTRVYTQGFYLAGNFFTFDDPNKINYDDAVFKFQQQNDQSINAIVETAETAYDVYMVEIPASLTAKAQVMYVDANGVKTGIFGPGVANKTIDKGTPATGGYTDWANITANESTSLFDQTKNYWNFSTRNESLSDYSDGLYEVYIAIDKNTHEPAKWMIKHQAKKRVAYFISDAPNATAMPLYDAYKVDNTQFSNGFYGTVNLAANRSYYVISNYIYNNTKVNDAKDYGTIKDFYLDRIPSPTTNKLFLQGNGDLEFTGEDPNNLIFPNGAPLKINKNYYGTRIVEYNPSRGNDKKSVYGFCGDLQLHNDRAVLTSVSMVGDAIPGTTNADGTWNYKSDVADMTYDETEQCYKATVVTTVPDEGKSKFRFVGNRNQKITWFEDSNSDDNAMAKHPYDSDDTSVHGHTADANDPNKVNYTENGDPTSADYNSWNIIWNRPAGRWTVRLYFYTYNSGDNDKSITDYYYTITASRDMELYDITDIVYGSETNKQNIYNKGEYKFLRTWSAKKTWKISNKVDVFVVNNVAEGESAVKLTLKKINKLDDTGKYHVIPANTGVILATKSAASEIAGAYFVARQNYTSYNKLVIPMEENESEYVYEGTDNRLLPLYYSEVKPASDEKNFNYFFAYYNALIATKKTDQYGESDYLLGFWISKGSKPYPGNSSYLPIPKEKAATMNRLGTSYDDFASSDATGGSAKKVPGIIFDFANVGGTTGINILVNQNSKLNDGKYYTLSGQQVEKPIAGGIYIHNGRKFVVK
nr:starch-binding protein [Prevotella sp.]